MVAPEPRAADHPEPGVLAAYVDRALPGDARQAVERHLASCDDCRDEVRALHRLTRLRAVPRPVIWAPLLAAAALAAVLLLPAGRRSATSAPHRDAPSAADSPLLVVPIETVAGPVVFIWRSVAGADQYRLTLLDADGRPLFEASSADTALALPRGIALAPGTSYFWKVEARMDFDRWIASPLGAFQLTVPDP